MAKQKSIKIQLLQYIVGGGGFFWSGYAAFAIFDGILHLPLFVAKQLANLIGLTVNYLIQDKWAFDTKKTKKTEERRRGRYFIITIVNLLIDYLIIVGLKEAGITPYLGQFASAGFFTIWNFLWYKYWVFAPHSTKLKKKRL